MAEPTIGILASAAGLAGVVWIVMSILRSFISTPTFDRWGAALAAVVGIAFSLAYAFVTTTPATGEVLLQAVLVGLFGGWMSQNVNTMVRRATG